MPYNFTAIDVGRGDAFYLKRNGVSVLVDGGQSKGLIKAKFASTIRDDGVNYLVCTHNDSDHANGILGFLQSGLCCDEVWLPGSWANRIGELGDDVIRGFIGELYSDCKEITHSYKISRFSPLSNLGDDFSKEAEQSAESSDKGPEGIELKELIPRLRMAADGVNPELYLPHSQKLTHEKNKKLFGEAIRATERIRAIARAASYRNIPIRWFEFNNSTAKGGVSGILEPVNSEEISRSKNYLGSALRYLALTTSNRESLVFCSPASDDFSGVLFLADSDLSFKQPVPADVQLFTAPHHGSEANAHAYTRLKMGKDAILVRSDARIGNRPGRTYLSQNAKKYCTVCKGGAMAKQPVRFQVTNGRWQAYNSPRCLCR